MKKKNILWKAILIIGIVPFVMALGFAAYSAVTGFSGLCILNCKDIYGIPAFLDSIIMYSYVFWPTYIVGLVMEVISIVYAKKEKSNKNLKKFD